jgi:hypothetical protein
MRASATDDDMPMLWPWFLQASQFGLLVASPLSTQTPVISTHVTPPSVKWSPRVNVHVGSVPPEVPATVAIKQRSLFTEGVAFFRMMLPTE